MTHDDELKVEFKKMKRKVKNRMARMLQFAGRKKGGRSGWLLVHLFFTEVVEKADGFLKYLPKAIARIEKHFREEATHESGRRRLRT
jgi:hypothetical protein